ncbi:MAG: phage tail sheath subtilisin-like domain-containing protein [Halopseudomonas sp.]
MPEYLAPGVYVEEISSGPKSIEALSTSTAGFVGQTERGPLTVTTLTSWNDYLRTYGGLTDTTVSYTSHAIKGFFDNGGRRAVVARVVRDGAGNPASLLLDTLSTQQLRIEANGLGEFGNRIFVTITEGSVVGFCLTIIYYQTLPPTPLVDPLNSSQLYHPNRREPDLIESYDNIDPHAPSSSALLAQISNSSQLIAIEYHHSNIALEQPSLIAFTPLTNGSDGTAAPAAANYIGASAQLQNRQGLALLETVEEISILAVPDEIHGSLPAADRDAIRSAIIHQCESLNDRFAILQVEANRNIEQITINHDSSYAAIYYPWIRVNDSRLGDAVNIPPCGHIAGIYARTDTESGVHKAPANAIVRGILTANLADGRGPLEYSLTDQQQASLNPRGINAIRDFRSQGRGVRVWGARTLSSNPEWRYISVRRLLLFLQQSINNSVQWLAFELNNETTWQQLRISVSNFLNTYFRAGTFQGSTPEQAYFVRCDRSTMTQDDIDNGRLICLVGVAAIKPAEFVIFRIQQKTAVPAPKLTVKPTIRLNRPTLRRPKKWGR